VLIDSPSSVLGDLSQSLVPLSARAVVYANFMVSPAVLDLIGQQMRPPIAGDQIYAAGPVNIQAARVEQEPTALKRNVEITGETTPYRLNFNSNLTQPTINIYSQAPTTAQAVALANASVVGLQRYVAGLERSGRIPASARVTIRQLGSASGRVVNGGISKALMALVFVAVFCLWCVLLLVAERFRENWRASAALQRHGDLGARAELDGRGGASADVGAAGAAMDPHGARPYMSERDPLESFAVAAPDGQPLATGSRR
jgi:hypothetical protein